MKTCDKCGFNNWIVKLSAKRNVICDKCGHEIKEGRHVMEDVEKNNNKIGTGCYITRAKPLSS